MNFLLKRRTGKAINNACDILMKDEYASAGNNEFKEIVVQAVTNRLDDKFVIHKQGRIIVTEIAFVTMALLAGHAIYKKEFLVIPGIDNNKNFGHLVLKNGFKPYHSLEKCIDKAISDAEKSHRKADRLLAFYGNKKALRHTAQAVPWYFLSKKSDAFDAGLCKWGIDSFLQRARIEFLVNRVGVPRFVLRFAGAYGDRVTAATLKRKAMHAKSSTKTTPKAKQESRLY